MYGILKQFPMPLLCVVLQLCTCTCMCTCKMSVTIIIRPFSSESSFESVRLCRVAARSLWPRPVCCCRELGDIQEVGGGGEREREGERESERGGRGEGGGIRGR